MVLICSSRPKTPTADNSVVPASREAGCRGSAGAGPYLLLGLAVLALPGLLLDVGHHGEGRAVVAVGQVDDVGDGGQHGALAAGPDGRALLTHGQEELGACRGG